MGDAGGMTEQDIRTSGALVGMLQAETRRAERRAEHMEATGTDIGKDYTLSWVTFGDGTEADIHASDVLGYMRSRIGNTLGNDVLDVTDLGGGLERVDVHLEAMEGVSAFTFGEDTTIPILAAGLIEGLRADIPYFILIDDSNDIVGAQVMACDESAVVTAPDRADAWEITDITLTTDNGKPATTDTVYLTDEDGTEHTLGEAGLDPEHLYAFYDTEADHWLTYYDLLGGLAILQASVGVAEQMREAKRQKPVTIRVSEEFPHLIRAKTRGNKIRGVSLRNRDGKEITRITAIENCLTLKPSGRKTLIKLDEEATKMSQSGTYRHDGETVCRVVIGVKETARLYGITEESARKRLRRDFKAIANESITAKKGKSWATIPIAGGAYGIRGNDAFFTLSPDFMKVMLGPKRPQLDLPQEIYATDDTNYPAALQIGFKLYNHDNLNYGRAHQDRMRLTTLLDAATELPKAGTVNRHETEKIMKPFEATMNHLVAKGVLKDWDYCHENGEPLTDEEQQAILTEHELGKPTPWKMAEGLLVTWELGRRYKKNEEERQASRDKRNAAALEAKAKKEKEARAKEKRIRGKVETMEAKKRFEDAQNANT